MFKRVLVLCLAIFLTFFQFSAAQSTDNSLEQRIDSVMSVYSGNAPGAVVAVVEDGQLIFQKGYGQAEIAHGIPNTTDIRFNIASASKQFMGFAFAMLAKRDVLSLEDPVTKLLPSLPSFDPTVTIRHLLTHTSGYREAYGMLALAGSMVGENQIDRQEAFEVVQRQPELEFTPGTRHRYNSTAFVILAEILEEATGIPYEQWMQQNVFKPLEMNHTSIETDIGLMVPNAAYSYAKTNGDDYVIDSSNMASFGAGDIITTVGDLAKWFHNFETAQVGGQHVIDQLTTPYTLNNGSTIKYGLGIRINSHKGLQRWEHGGHTDAFWSQVSYYPEIKSGVILMSNYNNVFPQDKTEDIAELFFSDHMSSTPTNYVGSIPDNKVSVPESLIKQYIGIYRGHDGGLYEVQRGNGQLYAYAKGAQLPLAALSDTSFKIKGTQSGVRFRMNAKDKLKYAEIYGPEIIILEQVQSWEPEALNIEKYTGRYLSPELETFYTLSVQDGGLIAEHRWNGRIAMEPSKQKNVFEAKQSSLRIRFVRNKEGDISGYYASIWDTEDVWFEKKK